MNTLFDPLPPSNGGSSKGDQLRDIALGRIRTSRPRLMRELMRAFLNHLLENGQGTADDLRGLVKIPEGVDPRVVGSAVRAVAEKGLTHSVGRTNSNRPEAHSRKIDEWAIRDVDRARLWLVRNPELPAPPSNSDDPFSV